MCYLSGWSLYWKTWTLRNLLPLHSVLHGLWHSVEDVFFMNSLPLWYFGYLLKRPSWQWGFLFDSSFHAGSVRFRKFCRPYVSHQKVRVRNQCPPRGQQGMEARSRRCPRRKRWWKRRRKSPRKSRNSYRRRRKEITIGKVAADALTGVEFLRSHLHASVIRALVRGCEMPSEVLCGCSEEGSFLNGIRMGTLCSWACWMTGLTRVAVNTFYLRPPFFQDVYLLAGNWSWDLGQGKQELGGGGRNISKVSVRHVGKWVTEWLLMQTACKTAGFYRQLLWCTVNWNGYCFAVTFSWSQVRVYCKLRVFWFE